MDLSIKAIQTKKSKIKSRPLMDNKVIPKGISSVIFNGRSGSGKSTLLINLLTRREFFGPPGKGNYFDDIYLFSPTGASDDMFDQLKLNKRNIFLKPKASDLQDILNKQRKKITAKGVDKAPRILVILEDCQSCKRFLASEAVKSAFIANRHYNMSTWICGQSYTLTPRACRLQANNIFYFKGSGSEKEKMVEEYLPSGLTKKEFASLIDHATSDRHSFLHINMTSDESTRYRKNLNTILKI
jgi:hypothetical protein